MVGCHCDWIRYIELAVGDNARGDCRHQNVEQRANKERTDDGDGHVALRIFRLLRRGADGVEADVGEENNTRAGHNAAPAEVTGVAGVRWNERMPVHGRDCMKRPEDEQQHHRHFHQHNEIVKVRRFLDADDKQGSDHKDD